MFRWRNEVPAIAADSEMERRVAALVLRVHQRVGSQISLAQLSIPELCRPVKQQLPTLHDHKARFLLAVLVYVDEPVWTSDLTSLLSCSEAEEASYPHRAASVWV